jgi:NAD(P)-dependent dehydrogenase (short-subunit alcohol dehydrogenase family)
MDLQLEHRVILVAGGEGLIGSAVVERLQAEGATVVVASRSTEQGIRMDGGDDASVAAGFARILEQYGRLDGLVVAAARSARTLDPALNADPKQIADAVEKKALVFLRLAQAAMPTMREAGFGRIVGISGQGAFVTGNMAGAVRNAALNIIGKSLADELAGTGVTVNTVNPAIVSAEPSAAVAPGDSGESSPAQIAALIAFLVSPLSVLSGESVSVGLRLRGVI